MPLRRTLPSVAILLVGQAVLDAGPAIVAEREGGMGLGSALIAASVVQIAGIVVGAILGGLLADRHSPAATLLAGALLTYVGLLATGIAPMGSLGTIVAGMGIAGIGFGFLLTAAFADAAALERPRDRAMAVVLLLAVPIAARLAVGSAFAAGPTAFVVAGATVVGLAILAVRLVGPASVAHDAPGVEALPSPGALPRGMVAAAILGLGTLLSVAAADPSRLSASLLAGMVGGGGLESLDTVRIAMGAIGIALLLVGAAMLLAGAERVVRLAAAGLLLLGLAGSGVAASMTRALIGGRVPDGDAALLAAAGALAGVVGLAIGGTLATGRRGRGLPAVIGGATVAAASVLGCLTLLGPRPEPGSVVAILLVAIAGLGLGIAASALRLALTDVRPTRRGLAAAVGVAAATIGSALGGMVGAGEGVALVGGAPRGFAAGLVGLMIAAAAGTGAGSLLPRRDRREPVRPVGDGR